MSKATQAERTMWSKHYTYDEWMEAQGIPIYRGYYIEDSSNVAAWLVGRTSVQLRVYPVGRPRGCHLRACDRDFPRQNAAAAQVRFG